MRAKDLDPEVRALASAPGHVCFSLTEDLHGCRSATLCTLLAFGKDCVCHMWAASAPNIRKVEGQGRGTGAKPQPFAAIDPRSKPASIFSCPA